MAIFSSGGTTYPDFYICLSLFILTLISVPLNSLVIRHNLLKQPSIPRNLFLLLAVCDLSASVYISIDFSVGALADKDIQGCMKSNLTREFCENFYLGSFMNATVADRIRAAIRYGMTLMPCYITGLLAISRFFQIKYPLMSIVKGKVLVGILVFAQLYNSLVFILFFREGDEKNSVIIVMPPLQSAWNLSPTLFGHQVTVLGLYMMIIFFVALLQIFAVLTSLLTIREMIKVYKNPMTEVAKKNSVSGSVKIMIANFGSFINIGILCFKGYVSTLGFGGTDETLTMKIMFQFWEGAIRSTPGFRNIISPFLISYTAIVPLVLSTLNPIIYVLFTPGSRKWRKSTRLTVVKTGACSVERK